MAQGRRIDEELRAQVVASLLTGVGVNETARRFNLSNFVVSSIKQNLEREVESAGEEKKERIDDLLLSLVTENIRALVRIARECSDPEYLKGQKAESVAELYEEMSRNTLTILEAASQSGLLGANEEADEQ